MKCKCADDEKGVMCRLCATEAITLLEAPPQVKQQLSDDYNKGEIKILRDYADPRNLRIKENS